MSDLFATNNPVIHCAPKRVRRRWGATVLTMLTLLAVAALVGWLWSCVRHAGTLVAPQQGNFLLAMAPVPKWVSGSVLGLGLFFSAALIVLAVRKVRENDTFCADLREKQVQRKQRTLQARREFCERDDWPHDVPAFTVGPLESLSDDVSTMILSTPAAVKELAEARIEPQTGTRESPAPWDEMEAELRWSEAGTSAHVPLPAEDLREIYGALVVTCCEARDMVRKATTDCSSEDYGDRLKGAKRQLTQVISCLGGLLESVSKMTNAGPAKAGTTNDSERSLA